MTVVPTKPLPIIIPMTLIERIISDPCFDSRYERIARRMPFWRVRIAPDNGLLGARMALMGPEGLINWVK